MNSSKNARGHDNNRDGPVRIDRHRWKESNSQGHRHHDKGRAWPAPEGNHIRFTEEVPDGVSTGGKRNRSHERNGSQYMHEGDHSESGRDSKRSKTEGEPASPTPRSEGSSCLAGPSTVDANELISSQATHQPKLSSFPPTSPKTLPRLPEAKLDPPAEALDLYPQSPDSGTQSPRSMQLRDVREVATTYQAELTFSNLELKRSRDEQEALKRRISVLEEACRQLPVPEITEANMRNDAEELEMTKESLQTAKKDLKLALDGTEQLKAACRRLYDKAKVLSATVSENENQIEELTTERDNLLGQLKALRKGKGRLGDESPIDLFDHRLDQVSEANIKSGVESLNDTLDNLVMELIDEGERIATKHSDLVRNFAHREHPDTLLFHALARHDLTPDNRGLLLDVVLHDQLHCELFKRFFFGDVASLGTDQHGRFQAIIEEMTQREPWTLVQRWRAITATSLSKIPDGPGFADFVGNHAHDIVALLAWAHGLSPSEYEPMSEMVRSRLLSLFQEAQDLCIQVRRDIMSVRMAVVSVSGDLFDPQSANSVWPEMGAAAGDKVVGRYRFGLTKLVESGQFSYLIKPEAATTALIRETSKNG